MNALSDDVIVHLMDTYADGSMLAALAATCRRFHTLIKDNAVVANAIRRLGVSFIDTREVIGTLLAFENIIATFKEKFEPRDIHNYVTMYRPVDRKRISSTLEQLITTGSSDNFCVEPIKKMAANVLPEISSALNHLIRIKHVIDAAEVLADIYIDMVNEENMRTFELLHSCGVARKYLCRLSKCVSYKNGRYSLLIIGPHGLGTIGLVPNRNLGFRVSNSKMMIGTLKTMNIQLLPCQYDEGEVFYGSGRQVQRAWMQLDQRLNEK